MCVRVDDTSMLLCWYHGWGESVYIKLLVSPHRCVCVLLVFVLTQRHFGLLFLRWQYQWRDRQMYSTITVTLTVHACVMGLQLRSLRPL